MYCLRLIIPAALQIFSDTFGKGTAFASAKCFEFFWLLIHYKNPAFFLIDNAPACLSSLIKFREACPGTLKMTLHLGKKLKYAFLCKNQTEPLPFSWIVCFVEIDNTNDCILVNCMGLLQNSQHRTCFISWSLSEHLAALHGVTHFTFAQFM